MNIRVTVTDTAMIVHDGLYEREPTPEETEVIRERITAPGLPWWWDFGVIAFCLCALALLGTMGVFYHGGVE